MKNLLFITHETTRTGAPLVLLSFLQWLQKHQKEVAIDLVALQGGDLEHEFKNVCRNYYSYTELIKPKPLTFWQRVLLKLGSTKKPNRKEIFLKQLAQNNYNIVYANTIKTIPSASEIIKRLPKSKLVAHLHELDTIIKIMLPTFKDYISTINQIIVPSQLVKKQLVSYWEVTEKSIEVVYECSQVHPKKQEGISKGKTFAVGASGTVHWRKGSDVFLQVARYMKDNYCKKDIKFVWVGRIPEKEKCILDADLQKAGLQENIEFVGEVSNPSDYFNEFDVFLMPSREDPFPLVCIEVGMLGKPIICFEGATGAEEIIKDSGGAVVSYLNIEAMAQEIVNYYEHPDLIKAHGDFNKRAFSQFTPEIISPKLFKILEKI